MKPSAFDYIRVETVDETLAVLATGDPDTKILAGGQSLLPMMNMRLAEPKRLVDINGLRALDLAPQPVLSASMGEDSGDFLEVGALVRQRQLERYTASEPRAQLLYTALRYVGHPQTRNQGTVGGSLAHADPSAELPLVFRTLGGRVFLQSARGERQVAAEDFFQFLFTTAIEPDELLTKIWWRLPEPHAGVAFQEFRRRHGDFALVAVACTMTLDGNQAIQQVRLGLAGVADTPVLIDEVGALVGERWKRERAQAVAAAAIGRLDLADDMHATAAYRRQLTTVLTVRALEAAYRDALTKEGLRPRS
jgi:CO/xanthine dehydrogenase FAD-binding subunit